MYRHNHSSGSVVTLKGAVLCARPRRVCGKPDFGMEKALRGLKAPGVEVPRAGPCIGTIIQALGCDVKGRSSMRAAAARLR